MVNSLEPLIITTVGDGLVGKSSLLYTYTQDEFPMQYEATMFDNFDCNLTVDDMNYDLKLHDTSEEYDVLRYLSYPNVCYISAVYTQYVYMLINTLYDFAHFFDRQTAFYCVFR